MKSHLFVACALTLWAPSLWAQQPRSVVKPTPAATSVPAAAASPVTTGHGSSLDASMPNSAEVWLYTQELRRYEDPAQAVRRKAEAEATQRMNRLAAMKWYGQSNSRPHASPIPTMGFYSPSWVGNSYQPYHWSGIAQSPRSIFVTPSYLR